MAPTSHTPNSNGSTQRSARDAADTVYLNGRIYTVDDDQPWAEALAVKDGRLLAVGRIADVDRLCCEHEKCKLKNITLFGAQATRK